MPQRTMPVQDGIARLATYASAMRPSERTTARSRLRSAETDRSARLSHCDAPRSASAPPVPAHSVMLTKPRVDDNASARRAVIVVILLGRSRASLHERRDRLLRLRLTKIFRRNIRHEAQSERALSQRRRLQAEQSAGRNDCCDKICSHSSPSKNSLLRHSLRREHAQMPRAIRDVWVIRRLSSHGCLKTQASGFSQGNCTKLGAAVFAGRSRIHEFLQQASLSRRDDVILFGPIEPLYTGRANRLFTLVQVRSIAPGRSQRGDCSLRAAAECRCITSRQSNPGISPFSTTQRPPTMTRSAR